MHRDEYGFKTKHDRRIAQLDHSLCTRTDRRDTRWHAVMDRVCSQMVQAATGGRLRIVDNAVVRA